MAKVGPEKMGGPTPRHPEKNIGFWSVSPARHFPKQPRSVLRVGGCFPDGPWKPKKILPEYIPLPFQNYQTAQTKTNCSNLANLYQKYFCE